MKKKVFNYGFVFQVSFLSFFNLKSINESRTRNGEENEKKVILPVF